LPAFGPRLLAIAYLAVLVGTIAFAYRSRDSEAALFCRPWIHVANRGLILITPVTVTATCLLTTDW